MCAAKKVVRIPKWTNCYEMYGSVIQIGEEDPYLGPHQVGTFEVVHQTRLDGKIFWSMTALVSPDGQIDPVYIKLEGLSKKMSRDKLLKKLKSKIKKMTTITKFKLGQFPCTL